MAEITAAGDSRSRRPRAHRMSTRVDLTPMVDLGFLLITFFMLTTVLAKPQVMPMVMPEDDGVTREPIKASQVLTLLLGPNDRVYWYEGMLENARLDSTDYNSAGLRRMILDKMDRVKNQWGLTDFADAQTGEIHAASRLSVIIRPAKNSRYKNLVDVLDEMKICRVRYYTILDILPKEEHLIQDLMR